MRVGIDPAKAIINKAPFGNKLETADLVCDFVDTVLLQIRSFRGGIRNAPTRAGISQATPIPVLACVAAYAPDFALFSIDSITAALLNRGELPETASARRALRRDSQMPPEHLPIAGQTAVVVRTDGEYGHQTNHEKVAGELSR